MKGASCEEGEGLSPLPSPSEILNPPAERRDTPLPPFVRTPEGSSFQLADAAEGREGACSPSRSTRSGLFHVPSGGGGGVGPPVHAFQRGCPPVFPILTNFPNNTQSKKCKNIPNFPSFYILYLHKTRENKISSHILVFLI